MFKELLKLMFSKYDKCDLVFFTTAKPVLAQRILALERTKDTSSSSVLGVEN